MMILYVMTDRTKLKLPIYVCDSMDELVECSGRSEKYIRKQIDKANQKGKESIYIIIDIDDEEGEK